jgi:hypothetical protein
MTSGMAACKGTRVCSVRGGGGGGGDGNRFRLRTFAWVQLEERFICRRYVPALLLAEGASLHVHRLPPGRTNRESLSQREREPDRPSQNFKMSEQDYDDVVLDRRCACANGRSLLFDVFFCMAQ